MAGSAIWLAWTPGRGGHGATRRQRAPRGLAVALLASSRWPGAPADEPTEPQPRRRPGGAERPAPCAVTELADEKARAELESEVGDVLSHYVVGAFLGDYPREKFVRAFDAFTGGAARSRGPGHRRAHRGPWIATPRRCGRPGSTPALLPRRRPGVVGATACGAPRVRGGARTARCRAVHAHGRLLLEQGGHLVGLRVRRGPRRRCAGRDGSVVVTARRRRRFAAGLGSWSCWPG